MMRRMWFGPRNYERWIPMVAPGADWGKSGWSERMNMLNGGARIKRSRAGNTDHSSRRSA